MSRVPAPVLRDLLREAELVRVLGAFRREGIEALLLKGAAYRGREYAAGEREARDADLLVRPGRFRAAVRVLRGLGYAVAVRGEAHAALPGAPVPLEIDLHARLYPDGDRGLWERARDGRLAPADAFVYALWHGAVRHARVDDRLREDLRRIAASGEAGFWKDVGLRLRERRLLPLAGVVLPALGFPLRARGGAEAWVYRWGLSRGPRGGTGHLLMALNARDPWGLARSAVRFLHGKCREAPYNPACDEAA